MSLILKPTGDVVRLVTSSTADIEYVVSYAIGDVAAAPMTIKGADRAHGTIATAATTALTTAPGASERFNVTSIELRNKHASASNDLTVQFFDGTNARELIKVTLYAGEKLVRDKRGMWTVYDATGGIRMGATQATASSPGLVELADQAEMEAATDTTRAVTPAGFKWHPGAVKFWVKAGVTGNILASHNVTSLTDTGAGQVTVTIADDFSSVNWCAGVTVERAVTTLAVTDLKYCAVRSGGQAAGSLLAECWDGTATTAVQEDPTAWHIFGLGDQ